MLGLTGIQTVSLSGGFPERFFFEKVYFEINLQTTIRDEKVQD